MLFLSNNLHRVLVTRRSAMNTWVELMASNLNIAFTMQKDHRTTIYKNCNNHENKMLGRMKETLSENKCNWMQLDSTFIFESMHSVYSCIVQPNFSKQQQNYAASHTWRLLMVIVVIISNLVPHLPLSMSMKTFQGTPQFWTSHATHTYFIACFPSENCKKLNPICNEHLNLQPASTYQRKVNTRKEFWSAG
jgi:hypothetical protein